MAVIRGGSILGEIRGKLGGMVFSRNRSGQIVRKYSIPLNPDTGAQLQARASFASAVGSFHSLTPSQKTQWENFAKTSFNPKDVINTGQFSGINAFTALKTMIVHGNKLKTSATLSVNGSALTPQPAYTDITFDTTPPVNTIQPNLQVVGGGAPANYGTITGGVAYDGSFEINLSILPGVSGAPNLAGFKDALGEDVAYAVYMSESHVQAGLFYQNPYQYLLGVIPISQATPTDLTGVTDIKFTSSTVIDTGTYQAFPIAGSTVRVSVFQISGKHGSMICIGTLDDGSGLKELEVGLTPY